MAEEGTVFCPCGCGAFGWRLCVKDIRALMDALPKYNGLKQVAWQTPVFDPGPYEDGKV